MSETVFKPEPPAGPVRRLSRVLGVVALLLSLVIFAFGVAPPLLLQQGGTWYKVPCTILTSGVQTSVEEEPWGNSHRRFNVYIPRITFKYTFRGQEYESDNVTTTPDETFRDEVKAVTYVAAFRRNTQAFCFVREEAPGEAVLNPDMPSTPYLFAFAAVVLALFGLFGIFSKAPG